MPYNPKLIKSVPGAAPDLRYKPNPAHSLRMKAIWKERKRKLAEYDKLKASDYLKTKRAN